MIKKIKEDIVERSIKKNFSLFPSQGKAQHQYDYRICKSELKDLVGYYFVVSKIIKYNGVSIGDYGYVVDIYDKNGDYIEDDSIQDRCKGKFFDSLINAE